MGPTVDEPLVLRRRKDISLRVDAEPSREHLGWLSWAYPWIQGQAPGRRWSREGLGLRLDLQVPTPDPVWVEAFPAQAAPPMMAGHRLVFTRHTMQIPASLLTFSLALTAAIQVVAPISAQIQDPGTSYWFRIPAPIAPQLRILLERRFDCLCGQNDAQGDLDIIVSPEDVGAFRAIAPPTTHLVTRGQPYRDLVAQVPTGGPDPGYFTTAEIAAELHALATAYPTLATVVDLTTLPEAARTHNNQPILALKVSDNVLTEEVEPAIVIAGQHHARELNAPFMVIGAMRRVLQSYHSDPMIRQVVDEHEIWFVPCVNPDGTDHVWNVDNLWRKNRRSNGGSFGVDNNRNYPFMWSSTCGGSTTASSQTYRGPSAASEPETRTMIALVRAVRPMLYLDFHSHGREVLFPYNTCATVEPAMRSLLVRYATDLRTPMNYGTRAPSASGEAPEAHWAESGTLSFLIETMTAFQPSFASVVAEEQTRVWPGVRQALTSWRPALRGQVRTLSGQPIEATVSSAPALFHHGERTRSRARDGLYQVWLPLGTHQVTFTANGYEPLTTTVTVSAYDQPVTFDGCLVPVTTRPTLTRSGSERIGTSTHLTYTSPGDAGRTYLLALALGTDPGIPVGCGRTLPLNGDALFITSIQPGSPILNGIGTLPASAQATAQLVIPQLPVLVGLTIHAGGITIDHDYPLGVRAFSNALSVTFQP